MYQKLRKSPFFVGPEKHFLPVLKILSEYHILSNELIIIHFIYICSTFIISIIHKPRLDMLPVLMNIHWNKILNEYFIYVKCNIFFNAKWI